MSEAALDLVYGMILEDGKAWGEVASDHQRLDMEAILRPRPAPPLHYCTRPRGGSKTTDIAAMALALLATDMPARSNGRVVASAGDQAAILIDAAAGIIARTPELEGVIIAEAERLINVETRAWVKVLAQSDSGSWGLRDCHLLVLDEFAQWPETRGANRVYTAMRSTVQKVPGCRMIILTSAGEPSHWSHAKYEEAKINHEGLWRVSEMPGPVPWHDPIQLQALKRELRPSEYDRLILNIWTEDEDRAIREEDWDAAVRGYTSLGPKPGVKYIITVDIGILNDATVMVVSHKEPLDSRNPHGPQRVVVDHVERRQGSKKNPVQLSDIESWLVRKAPEYNDAHVYADPTQFVGNLQNLNRRGVKAEEWQFTATSVGEVATALVQAFRSRQIWVPNLPTLREELLRVRLRESAPGVTRLDHDRGGHDDQAVCLGIACSLHLAGNWGTGQAFMQAWDTERSLEDSLPAVVKPSPSDYFFGKGAPDSTAPNLCKTPRFFDGRCVHCSLPIAEHKRSA